MLFRDFTFYGDKTHCHRHNPTPAGRSSTAVEFQIRSFVAIVRPSIVYGLLLQRMQRSPIQIFGGLLLATCIGWVPFLSFWGNCMGGNTRLEQFLF